MRDETLMRTVKKTHNIKLRENVSGRDALRTSSTVQAKRCSKRVKSSNEGRTHSCALLRRPTTLSWGKEVIQQWGTRHSCALLRRPTTLSWGKMLVSAMGEISCNVVKTLLVKDVNLAMRDHTITTNNGRRQGGVRKEEIQQWGTNTLMRTVKKTHNIKLREKG